jgi:hypothetical protein
MSEFVLTVCKINIFFIIFAFSFSHSYEGPSRFASEKLNSIYAGAKALGPAQSNQFFKCEVFHKGFTTIGETSQLKRTIHEVEVQRDSQFWDEVNTGDQGRMLIGKLDSLGSYIDRSKFTERSEVVNNIFCSFGLPGSGGGKKNLGKKLDKVIGELPDNIKQFVYYDDAEDGDIIRPAVLIYYFVDTETKDMYAIKSIIRSTVEQ